jgi:ribonuclease P protein component
LSTTFPKHQKLKSQKDIKALFEEGKIVTKYPVKLLWLPLSQQDTRAGFAVAKRNFKSAVARNKIKRLMREAYRLQKQEIQGRHKTFTLLFLYIGKDVASFKAIDKAVVGALKKLPQTQTAPTMNSTSL